MPLIKEIENALPFVADLPERLQRDLAWFVSVVVTNYDDERTMTPEQREHLKSLSLAEFERRIRDDE